ncbi:hypothetical protein LJR074_003246 [Acidovorax sp. LjRoot74]|uniref:hypothetical protein n=1 Tax=Acidovorax sp. LjRoot74 TaxID=3342337 RepID=UPI003ECF1810
MTNPTPPGQVPEALRLAEILEGDYCPDWFYEQGVDEVAAELRRLHAENERLAALVEAQQPAPSAAADPQLLKFYGVTTDAELIAAQARHIERLQAKLPQNQSFAPQRVREG